MQVISNELNFIYLILVCVVGIVIAWTYTLRTIQKSGDKVSDIMTKTVFLQSFTVLAIAAVAGILALEGILASEAIAAILSGIAGYVLGSSKQQ